MKRLTRETPLGNYTAINNYAEPGRDEQECVYKLGQLEDIEQYYGVDLVSLFKALKDGVYVKVEDSIWYVPAEYVSINKGMLFCDYNIPTYVLLKDKGKTWAFTKEELKNDPKRN